ncbi:MAG TPA: hypothetical protein VFN86_01910 [Casimicrobiaceae bacterium]|nr:hypothetical protein [Casimicrobiaceae bacterium]
MKATVNKLPLESASTLSPVSDAAPGSNIDQLRDIIFGGQMREYEKRFVRMEERLAKEIAEMREEVRQRCAALERYARDELESVNAQMRNEQQSRGGEERRLGQAIAEMAKATDERTAALTEQVSRQHRELRAQLLEQTQTLTDDAQRRAADLLTTIDREAARLREEKADRTALSDLLVEVALRLRGESVVPRQD